jgi:hypothetical protein
MHDHLSPAHFAARSPIEKPPHYYMLVVKVTKQGQTIFLFGRGHPENENKLSGKPGFVMRHVWWHHSFKGPGAWQS